MALTRFLAPLAALALLSACGDSADDASGRSATGEVIEGTISDDMLPLDRLRSEPPLLGPQPAAAGGSGPAGPAGEAGEAGAEEAAADAGDAAEEPAAEAAESEG